MEEIEKNVKHAEEFEPQYPAQLYTARPNPTALLSPLYDSTFKGIFTQETEDSNLALQSFISAVLGRNVKNVILKPNELPKDSFEEKGMSYDISVEFENGELSDIEMQAWKQVYDYRVRAEILVSRLLSHKAKRGANWVAPKVYQISILNFHYREDDNKEMTWYTMKDQSGTGLTDRQNIIFIDLETIRKKLGTPIDKLMPVEKWGLFFSYVDNKEYANYISELVRSEKGIMAAENIVKYMSEADENWFVQNSRYKDECDRNSIEYYAEKKGLEEGLLQGAQQKAIEAARNLYANGVSVDIIAKSLHMTEDEVREIVNTPLPVQA